MRLEDVVAKLQLAPHPEGGFYRETFRDPRTVAHPTHGQPRAAVTSIYFLLPFGTFSALHRVAQTEIWHHLGGAPAELHVLAGGAHVRHVLGARLDRGEHPHIAVPAGAWQAAAPLDEPWSLFGCTVAPGFDFADFEMPPRALLLRALPDHAELVRRFTRA